MAAVTGSGKITQRAGKGIAEVGKDLRDHHRHSPVGKGPGMGLGHGADGCSVLQGVPCKPKHQPAFKVDTDFIKKERNVQFFNCTQLLERFYPEERQRRRSADNAREKQSRKRGKEPRSHSSKGQKHPESSSGPPRHEPSTAGTIGAVQRDSGCGGGRKCGGKGKK